MVGALAQAELSYAVKQDHILMVSMKYYPLHAYLWI